MKLHVKVGTHPAYFASVVRKRKPPKVGEQLIIRDEYGREIRVLVDEIKDLGFSTVYFMELM